MGAVIFEIKTQIERVDNLKEKEGEVKEASENMRAMAADQLSAFKDRIRTSNHDTIGDDIKDAIKNFSSGPVADGIDNRPEIISIDPLGGISRLDALFFVYNFKASGLREPAGAVCAACIVKSSADVTLIDDNTLRVIVDQYFETSSIDLRKAIYGELRDDLFKSKGPLYIAGLQKAREAQQHALAKFTTPRSQLT